MKNVVFMVAFLTLLVGCNKEPEDKGDMSQQAHIDSLESIVSANDYAVALLDQVGLYLDSIDANRKWIVLDLETGLGEIDYIERMKNLNIYTQKAEWTIGELEKTRSAYANQVKLLKKQLIEKDNEIGFLQRSIAEYQSRNKELEGLLRVTEDELSELQIELDITSGELTEADEEIHELLNKVILSEAETYYAKGLGMESIAANIEFAPRRKRATLEEALKQFDQSYNLGYAPAREKIELIKQKLKIN